MRVSADEQQLCPCYEECQEFQKLVKLKDSGLVIYCHRPRTGDIRQAEAVESAVSTSRDVFILHNKKNVKITTSELTSELETKNISCPRCRKTFEHAQQLMQEVKSIDRKIVMGICDHCRKKATTKTKTTTTTKTMKKPFCACEEIVKKFIYVKGEQKEDIKKYVKIWLSKMGHLLKDDKTLKKLKQIETRAYSDLRIGRGLNSPAPRQEPEIQQMFYSGTHKSDINLNTEMRETNLKEGHMKQAVAFFQPIEHEKTNFALTPHESEKINAMIPSTSLVHSDTNLVKTYAKELPKTFLKDRKQEEFFEDIPSIDAKEALKRRHDLSLRQMMRLEKHSRVPYSVSKRPDIYETPKIPPWAQKDPTSKYQVESEMDIIMPTLNRLPRETRDLDYESNREVNFRSTRPSQDSYYETKIGDKYHHDRVKQRLHDSEEGRKTVKRLEDHYTTDEELKLQRSVDKISHKPKKSDQHVAKSKSWHKKALKPKESVGFDLKPEYSDFFSKVTKKKEKPIRVDVNSSHLIKDTQEKFRLQAETDMKSREEESQQKLERDQKNKLAREEKKLQDEEKKIQTVGDKKYAKDQKRQQGKGKRDKTKEDTFVKDGESEQKGKISKEFGVAKNEKKLKPDRVDEELDKAKKGTKSKPEQGDKIDKVLQKAKKDLQSKPEKEDKIAELLPKTKKDLKSKPETKNVLKAKSELKEKEGDEIIHELKKDLKEKPTQKSIDDDLISKAMKDQKKKHETRDIDDETTEKGEKDLKGKLESIEKGTKDLKSGMEQKYKINVPKKDLKAKSQQNDKVVEKEQNIKTEKERLKQIEQLRKEKEALKQQAAKEREGLSKETKSPKKKRDSSAEIKVSMSKIQKSINTGGKDESANKQEIFVKKQEEKKEKEGKQKELKVKHSKQEFEFIKLQAAHLKEKEEALKKKKQQEYEAKVAKSQGEADLKAKPGGLKLADINIQSGFSEDDLILKLVRIKQAATLNPSKIDIALIKEHKLCHHERRRSLCPLCLNSELELDVLSLDNKINVPKEILTDIVIGEKIFKIKRRLEKTKEPEVDPILYRKIVFAESDLPPREIVQLIPQEAEPVKKQILSKKDAKEIEMEPGKGVLRYALSDRTFIDNGWTMLPTEKVVRKMNVYRMRPAHPEFDWFEHNKNKRLMTYDTGERLAEFDDNGRGRWYYRNGRLALDYYDAEETNAQQRFVIYSSGEPDERGRTHPITILATFDYLGNGIVFDHTGKIRLKYNQTEGVVLDRGIGPVSHWKWHTLNDPPVLQQVMIDTQMAHKDPYILKLGSAADRKTRPDNEEMLAIEFDNFIKEKSKKLSQKFKPFQIKMKALKINEHFSLKVLDQATVYLIFRDGSTNLKLNIGMTLDHQEIVDTDTAEVGEVSNSLERFPARTDSLAGLQRSVAHAQRYERQHAERERRLRPAEPCASADQLTAAASPPLRLPFRTVPTASSTSTGYCSRKPTNNLYYNTRLL